jgi:aminopeptidase-like protein
LASTLGACTPELSYRFVFGPGTIGSVTWLSRNLGKLERIRAGLVIGLLGDRRPLTYKRSRRGDTEIDRLAAAVMRELVAGREVEFSPYGYDERQFCSPGIDLPMGRLTRSPNSAYPEYHTSADNLDLIGVDALAESIFALIRIFRLVDSNRRFRNLHPNCEPRLGKRGLFRSIGGTHPAEREHAILWLLNQSDGRHGLNDISAVSQLSVATLAEAAQALVAVGLLEEIPNQVQKSAEGNARVRARQAVV